MAADHAWIEQAHPMLLEVCFQLAPSAELQHRGKGVGIDLKNVHQPYNARVPQAAVDVVLSYGVLDIAGLLALAPAAAQLVHLHRDFGVRVQVQRLQHEMMR